MEPRRPDRDQRRRRVGRRPRGGRRGRPGRQGRGPRHRRRLRQPHAATAARPSSRPSASCAATTSSAATASPTTPTATAPSSRPRSPARRTTATAWSAWPTPPSIMPVRVLNAEGEGELGAHRRGHPLGRQARGARVLNVSIELYDPVYFQAQSITQAPEIASALQLRGQAQGDRRRRGGQRRAAQRPRHVARSRTSSTSAGTTEHGCLGDYSNYGRGMDLVAPGGGADANLGHGRPLQPRGGSGPQHPAGHLPPGRPGRFYVPTNFKGTSMAAPQVTGTVALMLAAKTVGRRPDARAGRHAAQAHRDRPRRPGVDATTAGPRRARADTPAALGARGDAAWRAPRSSARSAPSRARGG